MKWVRTGKEGQKNLKIFKFVAKLKIPRDEKETYIIESVTDYSYLLFVAEKILDEQKLFNISM